MKAILMGLALAVSSSAQAAEVCDVNMQNRNSFQSMTCTDAKVAIQPGTSRILVVKAISEAGFELKTGIEALSYADVPYTTLVFVKH